MKTSKIFRNNLVLEFNTDKYIQVYLQNRQP